MIWSQLNSIFAQPARIHPRDVRSGILSSVVVSLMTGTIFLVQLGEPVSAKQQSFPLLDNQCPPNQMERYVTAAKNGQTPEFALAALTLCGSKAVPILMAFLKDSSNSQTIRKWAARGLGKTGKDAVPALIVALKDEDSNVREWANVALRQSIGKEALSWSGIKGYPSYNAKDTIPQLIEILKDKDLKISFRQDAAAALGSIGKDAKDAVPVLIDILKDKNLDESFRQDAAAALGGIGKNAKDAVPVLIDILKDKNLDESFRQATAAALGGIGKEAKDAVPALIDVLKDKNLDESFRSGVARALGGIGKEARDAVPELRSVLKNSNDTLSHDSAWALVEIIADENGMAGLRILLKDPNPNVQSAAVLGLIGFSQKFKVAPPELINILRTGSSPAVREKAAVALGMIGNEAKSAVPELLRVLNEADEPNVFGAAALALGNIGEEPERVIPALVQALKKGRRRANFTPLENAQYKNAYYIAFAFRGVRVEARQVVPELIDALENGNEEVQDRMIWALAAIGPEAKAAVPELIKQIEKHEGGLHLVGPYITALGEIGPGSKSAIPALLTIDPTDEYNNENRLAKTFSQIGPIAVSDLINYLKSSNQETRHRAAYALAHIELSGEAIAPLMAILKNETEDLDTRRLIAYGLERAGQDVEWFFTQHQLVPLSRLACVASFENRPWSIARYNSYTGQCEPPEFGHGGGEDWLQDLINLLTRK